jgi:DNA-directed RNA polymerase specialized sigma24 family protein
LRQQTVLDSYLDGGIGPDHPASAEGNQAGEQPTTSELLARASVGDQVAWDQLVDRHGRLVWTVARVQGLDLDEAADASHLTWLLLAQHLGSLPQPERLGEWLAATAMRESQRIQALRGLNRRRRSTPPGATQA